MPDIGVIKGDLNQEIEVKIPNGWNSYKIGEPITLEITNLSQKDLLFDMNYGVRMFIYKDKTWIEVFDQMISFYKDDIILKPFTGAPDTTGVITVLPRLENIGQKILMRIFVFGFAGKKDMNNSSRIGGFVDISLEP